MLQLISFSVNAFQAEAGSGVENVFRRKPEARRKMFSGGSRKRGGKCFQAEAGSKAENVFRRKPEAVRKIFSGRSRKQGGKCFQAEAGSKAENVFRFRPDGTQDKDLPVENRKEEI